MIKRFKIKQFKINIRFSEFNTFFTEINFGNILEYGQSLMSTSDMINQFKIYQYKIGL